MSALGAQWLSGRVFDSRPKGPGFEPHRRHCVVSLSKNINPSLVLVQPRKGAQWLSGRVLDSRPKGLRFEPHRLHCVVVLEQDLVLVQPRKTRPCITERLLMGHKESNQTNKQKSTQEDPSLYN